ncbi:sigma 54-interacting transcriptional regulator [Clostridium sp. MSJ-4]|uniref:Sigma 54-interacting transcriptional regulator n=1 Tax=Clostridium simiarum TaxID=2841506 RepID=A0ABS6F088_9CLOT|nr:sigma-54-dependent transcriptional regulator [Clostridium simiarum]MBU5591900.1 sigma 54-interacting transcriptional regulator [Clostridium simiarum]
MKKIDKVYRLLQDLESQGKENISAEELMQHLNLDRTSISRYLNELFRKGKVIKINSRPVLYSLAKEEASSEKIDIKAGSLDKLIGADFSLKISIQQAKAAILYPPTGLHTLILGETGVGKSMFAELMYEFSKECNILKKNAPFIRFNCADYADNPQLLISQIFGVKKGAYTGADHDKEGLLTKANKGILFLDEVHRLPPQGQEMLFTFIDKGSFRPLGETENIVKVQVQIIAATTEYSKSTLLKTFLRRIPMVIELPPLRERSLVERYYLLVDFIKAESKRLNKSIYIDKSALTSYLLYDCPNNIGQLKSNIQLASAKAFLKYKTNNIGHILIDQEDLEQEVKKGLMKIQDYRKEINEIFKNKGDILRFNYSEEGIINNEIISLENNESSEIFYDVIEKKLSLLKSQGLSEKEINQILNIDIESYFSKYMNKLPEKLPKDQLYKFVTMEIGDTVEEILNVAKERLNKSFDEKVYIGLAIHLQGSIERIKNGNKIYNPKLNFIRIHYSSEFLVAMELAKIIDSKFNIEIPLDEIGYLAMFLASDLYESKIKKESKVGILVIMHGDSTASSMVRVANSLIGEVYTEALDMPLTMKAEKMYDAAKNKIIEMDKGKGVLLLVDMGSLTNFGEMISEETGISIKTIDMVSTPIVIEACSKALLGRELQSIYKSCLELSRCRIETRGNNYSKKKFLIITACFTGEGASETLKQILIQSLTKSYNIEIIALNILDHNDFLTHVDSLSEKYKIIALVGTVNMFIENIPFIPAPDILSGEGVKKINKLIEVEENYMKIDQSLKNHLNLDNVEDLVEDCRVIIRNTEEILSIIINEEAKTGIILHLAFMIDRIKNKNGTPIKEDINSMRDIYTKEFILIKQTLKPLEEKYDVNINDDELANIVKIIINNNEK